MLWLFCGFYFLFMCGGSNYKVVFPFCFGFVDAWGYDFPFLVVLLMHGSRNSKVFSWWCFGIWGLIFKSSLIICSVLWMHEGLISKRFDGFLQFYQYNMGFDFLQLWIRMGQQLTNFLAFWALLMHVIFCGYVWCVGSRRLKLSKFFLGYFWCVGAIITSFMTFVLVLMCESNN